MEKNDSVDMYINLKGTIRDHGEPPQNEIEALMADFVHHFENTLSMAVKDEKFGLKDMNPRILIAMGLSNIVLNMILTFNDDAHVKKPLNMLEDLMKDVHTLCRNGIAMIQGSKADESNEH